MDLWQLLASASPDDRAAWQRLVERVGPRTLAGWLSPGALRAAMLADTSIAAHLLEALRTDADAAAAVAAAFPEVPALAAVAPAQVEHDVLSDRPLLDHVATRLLGRRLAGLEATDLARFQDRGLSPAAFAGLAEVVARLRHHGLLPALRLAILHLDIAKTANADLRARWTSRGIPLDIHNEAAEAILASQRRWELWPLPHALGELAIAWVGAHGLAGQHVRGEGPLVMYAPFVATVRGLCGRVGDALGVGADLAATLILDGLHVLDACDTGAVREGLLDDALLARLAVVRDQLATVCVAPASADDQAALTRLAPRPDRGWLADRVRALRAGRQRAGEPAAAVDEAVAAIGDVELAQLAPALATCQLWYCEAATSGLSPAAQLGVLAAAVGAARRMNVDVTRPWHAQLRPLVARLHGETSAVRYRLRLVEAALARTPLRALLTGGASLGPLGTLSARLAHATDPDAIVIEYQDSEESAALVTLLGVYETRSAAAYHSMLKALCDLYGLRKDEFDRVANEANYLATMNAARSDKQRMLDFVVPARGPGTLVEIGPGGGVVLDLLEARFPDAEIIGVDLSREVIGALEAHARAHGRRWRVVHGAAEDLAAHVAAADTVVFCSILHEVYAYTEPRFQLASIEKVVRAAFDVLRPGGRIVIRDGVMPPAGTRRLRLLAPDLRPTLELFCAQFEGRAITYRELSADRVEMSAADAMEFLYTYTWGPASFPYEVRELYGVLTYDAYVARLVAWCGGEDRVRVVDNPLKSYLQPGYRDHLAAKVELTDEHDRPATLPDSNCLIVLERR